MPLREKYSDAEIVHGIKAGGKYQEQMTQYLFDAHIGFYVQARKKYRLVEEELQDAYTDAILGVIRAVVRDRFRQDCKLSTYLYSIFQKICISRISRRKEGVVEYWNEEPQLPSLAQSTLQKLVEEDQLKQVDQILKKLGDTCRQLLWDALYFGFSMEEITIKLGFKNVAVTSSKKYKCLSKLKHMVKQRKLDHIK